MRLELQSVGIRRDFRWLVSGLHAELSAGDCCHLRGENGAGKTTLLRALVGLRRLDAGQLLLSGKAVQPNQPEFQSQVLYLGHQLGVTPELTVAENVHHFARLQGISRSAAQARLPEMLSELGLSQKTYVPARDLSAGQKRRVGLSRLWLADHRLLWLLDEPLTALDVAAVALLQQRIREHCESGGIVLMTSHQALDCANKIVDLSDFPGQVEASALFPEAYDDSYADVDDKTNVDSGTGW